MTEKELTQAKHRLEEAEAQNRVKERKARTRRLIQEGAILEKVFPQTVNMDLERFRLSGLNSTPQAVVNRPVYCTVDLLW